MDWHVIEIIITGLITLLASSGFWTWEVKRLERKYAMADKHDETEAKLDKLIKSQEAIMMKLDKLSDDFNKSNKVTMAVARDRIYYLCKKWIEEKNIDPDNMRDIKAIFEPYRENEGNGVAEEYFKKYEHMYRTTSREAK